MKNNIYNIANDALKHIEALDDTSKFSADLHVLQDTLEAYNKALLNVCLYLTELNNYHNKPYKVKLKRAKQYANWHLGEELKNNKKSASDERNLINNIIRKQIRLVVYKEEDYECETHTKPILTCVQEIPDGLEDEENFIKYLYFRFAKDLEQESKK